MGAAAVPMAIGSAIGAATSKNPLQGAILGGFLGGAGGALLPTMSTLGSTASGILPSAASGSMTAATNPALVTASMPSAAPSVAFQTAAASPTSALGVEAAKTGLFGGAIPTTSPMMQGQGLAQTTALQRPLSLTMPGVEPGQGYEYTLGDRLNQVGQFAQQNPVLTQMAMRTGQDLLSQQPAQPAPAGLMRGSPSQVAAPQYQVGIPRVSLI